MSKVETKSFTFRVPLDVHEVFMAQVEERGRSHFAVQALRQALGLATEAAEGNESGLNLAARIDELSYRLEVMKTEQDKVMLRLASLEDNSSSGIENALQSQTESKTEADYTDTVDALQSQTESKTESGDDNPKLVIQSQTESKTNDSQDPTQSLSFQLNGLDHDVPDAGELTSSHDLLEILKREAPQKNWTPSVLRYYRQSSRATTWHTLGNCKFIYANNTSKASGRKQHFWRVIHLSPESEQNQ
jgi:hypothetical protein